MSPLGRIGRRLAASLRAFPGARSGSTAIEYTVIAALVCTAIVASFGTITGPLTQLFTDLSTKFVVP